MRDPVQETPIHNESAGIMPLQEAIPSGEPEHFKMPQNAAKSVRQTGTGDMPSPIRYFSYFFFTSSALLLVIGVFYQLLK
ncbi:hypothetical protein [Paenibacillus rigui]|uniref:Uncharacterized protein n=1 Tax=Paenibacillus rigui TaxID=554312 RepID=A0A229UGC7_9BACL|nr:hypothetical protein [Paenibacillus rigui]OXM82434.1 hypothetical protein CF651_30960 [Paenibacillus rigui]